MTRIKEVLRIAVMGVKFFHVMLLLEDMDLFCVQGGMGVKKGPKIAGILKVCPIICLIDERSTMQ